jgi:hypothetical protein
MKPDSSVDHFPNVDAYAVAHPRQLVHEPNVDYAERVLEQLYDFSDLRQADRDHLFKSRE